MKIKTSVLCAIIAIFSSLFLGISHPDCASAQKEINSKKEECLRSVMAAVEMEIARFEQKLEAAEEGPGDPGNAPVFEGRINELRAEYEKYQRMPPSEYALPEEKTVEVNVTHAYQPGALLEAAGLSRSGPFYHIAGIVGDNYEALQPGRTYILKIYLVYPRDYFFPSDYVYIGNFKSIE